MSNAEQTADTHIKQYITVLLAESAILTSGSPDKLPVNLDTLNQLILELHLLKGHRNFQAVIAEFRVGAYDDDPQLLSKFSPEDLDKLKLLSTGNLSHKQFDCLDCKIEKIRSKDRKKISSRPIRGIPMRRGYVDIVGPFPPGVGGTRYYFLYICDDSSYGLIEGSTDKEYQATIKPTISAWRLHARDQGWKMEQLHFDADQIFLNRQLQEWLASLEVSCDYAPPGQHWKNGLVEAFNKVVEYNGKTMLRASGLPYKYWFFAFAHAVFLHNIARNKRLIKEDGTYNRVSAWELVHQQRFTKRVPIFGQEVMARDPKANNIDKLESRGRECAFLCMSEKEYTLLHLRTGRIIRSADIEIVGNVYAYNKKPITYPLHSRVVGSTLGDGESQKLSVEATEAEIEQLSSSSKEPLPPNLDDHSSQSTDDVVVPRRSPRLMALRDTSPKHTALLVCQTIIDHTEEQLGINLGVPSPNPDRLLSVIDNVVLNVNVSSRYLDIGQTYTSALSTDEARECERKATDPDYDPETLLHLYAVRQRKRRVVEIKGVRYELPTSYLDSQSPDFNGIWDQANQVEVQTIIAMGALGSPTTVKPPDKLIITSKFDYKIKTKKDGSIDKLKVRCVIRGFMQKYGVHYHHTYSPTVMKESIRLILYLLAIGYDPMLYDIKGAFLNAPMDTELWVEYPPGFPGYDTNKPQWALVLKAWYGSHQAAKLWNDHLKSVLPKMGYTLTNSDHGLWYKRDEQGRLSIMGTHVDDCPGASEDPDEKYRVAAAFEEYYEISFQPTIEKVLGLLVHVNSNHDVIVYNDIYFDDMALDLGMQHLKPSKTFGDPKKHFEPNTLAQAPKDMHSKYRQLIGGLMWPALQWRPEINHVVCQLGRFTHNPSFEHFDAAIMVFRYCLGTKRRGICYRKPPHISVPKPLRLCLIGYYDSDWAKDWDRISNSGATIQVALPDEVSHGQRTGTWPDFNLVHWTSKKQTGFAATSTAAAESKASTVLAENLKWARGLFIELGVMTQNDPPCWMLGDNDAATINLAENRVTPKTRAYELDIIVTRTAITNGVVKPGKIPTNVNLADNQTKIQTIPDRDRFIERTMSVAETGMSSKFRSQVTSLPTITLSERPTGAIIESTTSTTNTCAM